MRTGCADERQARCLELVLVVTAGSSFVFGYLSDACASEDIEFVAEHLAGVAMDNRYATLPAFGFMDALSLSGNNDRRPLQTLFAPSTPLHRPVDAEFDDLDGQLRHFGAGLDVSMAVHDSWLGPHSWTGGILWEQVALHDYGMDYEILAGPSTGVTGHIDFDAHYAHVTPFVGLEIPRHWHNWAVSPHLLLAIPLPRRGVVGHISGPGFDLSGDTQDVGNGSHFGDPSLAMGLDISYLPAHLTIDVGTILTQRFLEPLIHEGIEGNWVVSCQWRY